MPGSVANAVPVGVLPASLCTAFLEVRAFEALQNQYHDGTLETGQLAQSSRKTFKLSQRLSAVRPSPLVLSPLELLKAFWEAHNGGMVPFAYYNPFEPISGQPIGSNYDPTGASTVGRYTVVFRGNWSQSTGLARTDVPQLQLVEVA
jgi:hypothetical protein